jgi:acetolactate synthase-1/2/3 large subunit
MTQLPQPGPGEARHGGDSIAEVLVRHRVETLFTLCGGHISPILVGAKARGIRVVDTRHEANAVFAADATARLTGLPGVAAVTAGPGLTNVATAVQNARMAQSPVVVLGGATATVLKGRGSLQDIDQQALAAPLFKWQASARRAGQLVPLLEEALWRAREGVPGPVFLECPVDLLYPAALVREWYGLAKPATSLAKRMEHAYLGFHLKRIFRDAAAELPTSIPRAPEPPRAGRQRVPHGPSRAPSARCWWSAARRR